MKANPFGLFDIHGNVDEWVQDGYGGYQAETASDPTGPNSASGRVFRGGSWCLNAGYCRSANRYGLGPASRHIILGFRVALSPSGL